MAGESRWPLNIWMWREYEGITEPDFTATSDKFDEARDLICAKLKNEGFEAGMMWADATGEGKPDRIELHYQAFDDPYRGRIVAGGLSSATEANEYVRELKEQYAKKVFTPNELYALTPVNINNDFTDANGKKYRGYMGHIEQWLKDENICLHSYETWDKVELEDRVQLRFLVNEQMGSDESFEIGTLWFDNKPLAVVTHTGEDNSDRYITDVSGWYEMVAYLRTFMVPEEDEKPTMVDPNKPLHWLTEPDGYHTLHDFYDVEKQEKKEKVTA